MAKGTFKSGLVTLTGSALKLSTALQLKGQQTRVARLDLQPGAANAAASYYGDTTVATTGVRMEAAESGIPPAPSIWEVWDPNYIDLDDVYVIGTNNETLRVHWIQYV